MKRAHHDLVAWQEGMALVKLVYDATKSFPDTERYGLTSQMRRAAISIPANIAEGAGRSGTKEFVRYLGVARGSLSELDTLYLLAKDLGFYAGSEALETSIDRVFALLGGLINSERARLAE